MRRAALIILAAGLLAACGEESTEEGGAPAVTPECEQAFARYDRELARTEGTDEIVDEGPLQLATLRNCSREEWFVMADRYGERVVLAEPEKVHRAFCGDRKSLRACHRAD